MSWSSGTGRTSRSTVLPGGKASVDLTADAPGDGAFHCHTHYHMHAGMMRVVTVRPLD